MIAELELQLLIQDFSKTFKPDVITASAELQSGHTDPLNLLVLQGFQRLN